MIPKDLDDITEEDLQFLVDNCVLELRRLEYKGALPDKLANEHKKFLAAVSSFANASGGDLIVGITEDRRTGAPKDLVGLAIQNVDQEILKWDNVIRNGIEPRLPSVAIRPVPLANGNVALVVRVRRSWLAPHRVSLAGHNKFYARGSNGKFEMDVSELRTAFSLSATLGERARRFRDERLSIIYADEGPVSLGGAGKLVLHLIPLLSLEYRAVHDISKAVADSRALVDLMPIVGSVRAKRYNLDGFLTYDTDQEGLPLCWVQLFRSGIIEAVDARLLRPRGDKLSIPSTILERRLIESLPRYLSITKAVGVDLPIVLFITLLGVDGYWMAIPEQWQLRALANGIEVIDREIVPVPEVMIESYDIDPATVLQPCFDAIWNACGFPRSPNFNDKGEWVPV